MRAMNMVRQATSLWGGSISDKSLLQFLCLGHLAPDVNREPDGMTSLGFVPHHERHRFKDKSNAATDNMRAMFGEKTFNEDSIKRHTKKQFVSPSRIEDWATQLNSIIRFIHLLSTACKDGMASEACRTAYDLCDHHEQSFRSIFQSDKLMGVKILCFLDRVFQEVAADLSRFAGQTDPLRAASASLGDHQRNTVIQTPGPLRHGIQPPTTLPPGLVPEWSDGEGHGREPNHGSNAESGNGRGRTSTSGPNRMHTSSIPNGWKIPDGKIFRDFFNPRGEGTRGNISGWRKTPLETAGSPQQLCVRLVTAGKCVKTGCNFSHTKHENLSSRSDADAITARLAETCQQG
jgi:hypothetical protein